MPTPALVRIPSDVLELHEQQYQSLVENIPDVVFTADVEGQPLFLTPNVEAICGFTADEILTAAPGFWYGRIHKDDVVSARASCLGVTEGEWRCDYRWQHQDGRWIWLQCHAQLRTTDTGRRVADGTFSDVSECKRLEEQFRQSQKVESLGQLTSGIAHDFNNLLTVILGNAELLMEMLPTDHEGRTEAAAVIEAAQSATGLSRQLLAFSRRHSAAPHDLDLRHIIVRLEPMLRRVIGEDVILTLELGESLPPVHVDRGHMEQVLMNLVVNARDAMPHGGHLSMATAHLSIDGPQAALHKIQPGPYVKLEVRDSGCGMDADTARRVFEPFFTTKEQDKGTGLGLSTCASIIAEYRGTIMVDSKPGRGTLFTVLLPTT